MWKAIRIQTCLTQLAQVCFPRNSSNEVKKVDHSPTQGPALDLQAALLTLTPHTRTPYKRYLAGFLAYCSTCGWNLPAVELLRPLVLEAWLAHLRQCGRAAATCKQAKAAVCWAARQAKRAGEPHTNALINVQEVTVTGGGGVRQGRWL